MERLEVLLRSGAEWDLEGLVREANARLPRYMPDPGSQRVRETVTARLVRHYTGLGMLDEPLRRGREARYSARHLLQLLLLRRLMAEGHGTSALGDLARRKSDAELLAMLEGGVALTANPPSPALSYLSELRQRYHLESSAPLLEAPAPPPTPDWRWHRLEVAPGLELHVREDFQFPKTRGERDALMQRLHQQLEALRARRTKPRTTP